VAGEVHYSGKGGDAMRFVVFLSVLLFCSCLEHIFDFALGLGGASQGIGTIAVILLVMDIVEVFKKETR
jgi:hypothetical protein